MLYGTESLDLLARNSKIDAHFRASMHKKARAPRSNRHKKNGLNIGFKPFLILSSYDVSSVCGIRTHDFSLSRRVLYPAELIRYKNILSGVAVQLRCGRGSRNRTHDTRFWRPLLYQLSYTPIFFSSHLLIIIIFKWIVKGNFKNALKKNAVGIL